MIYAVIAVYFGLLLWLGILASRRVKSISDYYVGGKQVGYWVAAFSARATGESAWLYLGLTGLGAAVGVSALWVVVGELIGVGAAWFLMASPFKRATDQAGAITVPDYLMSRFGSDTDNAAARSLRLVAAGALALFVTIYVSAQIDATGKAFASFLDWNYYVGSLVGFGIVVAYTSTGGFLAVVWSDLVQGLLMLVGLVLLPLAAFIALEPGSLTSELSPALLNPWGPGGLTLPNVLTLVSYAAIGIGFLGSPQIFTRFIAIRDQSQIRTGRWVALGFTLVTDTGAVLSGLFGRALLVGADGDLGKTLGTGGEQLLPLLVEYLFPTVVVGIFVAAVLAAIMSTADSFLNIGAAAVVHDIPRACRGRSLDNELYWARVATVSIAAAAAMFALFSENLVALLGAFGWGTFAAAIVPTVAIGFNWKRATPMACNLAIGASLLVNFFLEVRQIKLPYGFHGGAFSLLISLTIFYLVSVATPPPSIDADIDQAMDL